MKLFLLGKQTAKLEEIELGSRLCRVIKEKYFNEIPWVKCHSEVTSKFTSMKNIYRRLFPSVKELDMLLDLSKYNTSDVEDLFSHANYEVKESV